MIFPQIPRRQSGFVTLDATRIARCVAGLSNLNLPIHFGSNERVSPLDLISALTLDAHSALQADRAVMPHVSDRGSVSSISPHRTALLSNFDVSACPFFPLPRDACVNNVLLDLVEKRAVFPSFQPQTLSMICHVAGADQSV